MPPFPDVTIYQGLAGVADERAGEVALVEDGESWTYREILADARELAGGLAEVGVTAGDTVAVWLANRREWILTQLAASYLGAAVVAVNTRYRTHELEYLLDDADCSVLVTETAFLGNQYLEMLAEVVPSVATAEPTAFEPAGLALEAVLTVDAAPSFPAVRRLSDLAGAAEPPPEPADDPTTPAAVFYTSGTTGEPKGCLQSARSVLNHSALSSAHIGVSPSDRVLGVLPFPGVWGYNTWLGALARGGTLVVQDHFEPAETARLVDDHDVTAMSGMAAMFTRTLEAAGEGWTDSLERGVICFLTLSYDPETFDRVEDAVGFPLVQPYGLSEANSQVFVGRPSDPRPARKRVGGPLVSGEQAAKVVDPETGERVPEGETGELLLRGYNVMNGYLGKPEATAAAIDDDGWLQTGDLVSRDGTVLEYHSRLADALRVRGFLVTPREIEVALEDLVGIEAAQVVGAPHDRHGQVPVAFVRRSAPDLAGEDVRSGLADAVADYKVPAAVEFVESFPRTEGPHGEKVQKHELRERARDLV